MIRHVGKMTVAAHRGDSYHRYANTMGAYEYAIKSGCDMIECDIHITKDDKLILIHDHTVDRTTNGSGKISDMTAAEIRELNAGDEDDPQKVPYLEELMRLAVEHDITLNLEIKEYYSEENEKQCIKCIEAVISMVEKYNMTDKVVLNSIDAFVLEYIYKHYGKKYMLHGFYPYYAMKNSTIDPNEYLYCACICFDLNREDYEYLISHNVEPWIGAGVTQESKLGVCSRYGARLITCNNVADTITKLKNLGLR